MINGRESPLLLINYAQRLAARRNRRTTAVPDTRADTPRRQIRERVTAYQASVASGSKSSEERAILHEVVRVKIPVLEAEANVTTAGIIGIVIYVIFCFRAGNHVGRAAVAAEYLLTLEPTLGNAILTTPTIVTTNHYMQCLSASALGGPAAYAAHLLLNPIMKVLGEPTSGVWIFSLPAAYLGVRLLRWNRNIRNRAGEV